MRGDDRKTRNAECAWLVAFLLLWLVAMPLVVMWRDGRLG